jgi:hypothetical protein
MISLNLQGELPKLSLKVKINLTDLQPYNAAVPTGAAVCVSMNHYPTSKVCAKISAICRLTLPGMVVDL